MPEAAAVDGAVMVAGAAIVVVVVVVVVPNCCNRCSKSCTPSEAGVLVVNSEVCALEEVSAGLVIIILAKVAWVCRVKVDDNRGGWSKRAYS